VTIIWFNKEYKMQRRDFMKTVGSIAITASFPAPSLAADIDPNDFKAIVLISNSGGIDGFNMFVPVDNTAGITTGYANYSSVRANVHISDVDLTPKLKTYIDSNDELSFGKVDNPYAGNSVAESYKKGTYVLDGAYGSKVGINSMMPEMAHLALQNKLAIVHNVGSIPKPITKYDKKFFPNGYSAHDNGTRYVQTGQATNMHYQTGWLGRLADNLKGINSGTIYPLNINFSGLGMNRMMFSFNSPSMNASLNGPVNFSFGTGRRPATTTTMRTIHSQYVSDVERRDMFRKLYNSIRKEAVDEIDELGADWNNVENVQKPFASLQNIYKDDIASQNIFSGVDIDKSIHGMAEKLGNIGFLKSFKAAANMIQVAKNRGLNRVVIHIHVGGWDHHNSLASLHAYNLRGLSTGVGAFMRAIKHIGLEDNVTMMNYSEFGRTLADNGSGADHAWGNSYFVVGGAVKGGNYGMMPEMDPKSDYFGSRGILIPTTSYSQHFATVLKWFGANDADLDKIFPELKNFSSGLLGFMG
jgi:uncharacterized protein (DUF1501 family)